MARANVHTHRILIIISVLMAMLIPVAANAVSLKDEIDLGNKLDVEILKETPEITDEAELKQINEYGQRLVKGVQRHEIVYHFRIIKDNDFNAFSIPGGYVYYTDRLWNVLRPDERIGVLAHEIIHVDRRHALDAMSKAQKRSIFLAVLLTAVGANNTVANITDIAHQLYTLKYSRGDERQADEYGMDLVNKAGYNPTGMLLAMRKINRFQNDAGGEPPKIFSSHPPTPERLKYIEEKLKTMGYPIPPENVAETTTNPYKVGEVTTISDNSIQFTSTKALDIGDSLWVMGLGWDSRYENRTIVPLARVTVTAKSNSYSASMMLLPNANEKLIVKGVGVYMPPVPEKEQGIGSLAKPTPTGGLPNIQVKSQLKMFDRLLVKQAVWNKDRTKLVYDTTGYIIVTNPGISNGYTAVTNPEYPYTPVETGDSVLTKLQDTESYRWLGPVASIGRGSQAVEVKTNWTNDQLDKAINSGKRFDIVYPAWDQQSKYKERIIANAVLKSKGDKIVLQITQYNPGKTIDSIAKGYDIYESKIEQEQNKEPDKK